MALQSARYVAAATDRGRAARGGAWAYFAGGCVRDLLLGVEAKDFDVATRRRRMR